MPPAEDFVAQAEGFRRELLAYCYRMLGSVTEAEDLVQETYLNAWRSMHTFEGRSSLRTWLYRIATRVCLKAVQHGARRPLPSGLHGPSLDHAEPVGRRPEVSWLQPIPDTLLPADPATVVDDRQTVRLALVAALQYLSGRQRAVLILRDVLRWRATEVAELFDTTTAAVNSTLQRARAQLGRVAPAEADLAEPPEPVRRALLDRYAAAFENSDVAALTRLLTEDATWEMPPIATWFTGRETVTRFLATRLPHGGGNAMVPSGANGQAAFAFSMRDGAGIRPHAIHVLTLTEAGIAKVVAFHDPGLFAMFQASLTSSGG